MMTTLSKELRNALKEKYNVLPIKIIEVQECKETSKFLFETSDGNVIETVLMYHFRTDKETGKEKLNRMTLCISSQV